MGKRGKRKKAKTNKIHSLKKKQKSQKFKDDHGNIITPIELVFPIVRKISLELYECVGSGFFIHPAGGFVTAKHVLFEDDHYDENCFAIHTISKDRHVMRKIVNFQPHPTGDIGMGMLAGELRRPETGEIFLKAALPISKSP